MGLRIYQNVAAITAHRNLKTTDSAISRSLERLSTGLRINRAADDAAGLSISEKLRAQVRGLVRAQQNAQDAISLVQTAEGALSESHSILQRMRELSIQSANGVMTSNDRGEIQKEVDQLLTELDRVATNTEFNTKKILDGTSTAFVTTSDIETKAYVTGDVGKGGNYRLTMDVYDIGQQQIIKTKQWRYEEEVDLVSAITAGVTVDGIEGNQIVSLASVVQPTGVSLNLAGATESFEVTAYSSTSFGITGNISENMLFGYTSYNGTDYGNTAGDYAITIDGQSISIAVSAGMTVGDVLTQVNKQATSFNATINLARNGILLQSTDGTSIAAVTASGSGNLGMGYRLGLIDASDDSGVGAAETLMSVSGSAISYLNIDASKNLIRGTTNTTGNDVGLDVTISLGGMNLFEVGETATFNATNKTYLNADASTRLGDITAFSDSNGVSIFSEQELIIRSNNKEAKLVFSSSDTVGDMASKIQAALTDDLGMGQYWANAVKAPQLVSVNGEAVPGTPYWDDPDNNGTGQEETNSRDPFLYKLPGTMYISSGMVGELGNLSFSGDESLLTALGIVEVQAAENATYDISVTNLHTGNQISSMRTSNYRVSGLIEGLDIKYDPMVDIIVDPDGDRDDAVDADANEPPVFTAVAGSSFTYIHVAPNSLKFQIGANEGQTLNAHISDMSTGAMGIENLQISDVAHAEEAISMIDGAIAYISSERSRLGSYQNRLEHTIQNLGVAAENLSASESRIRDLDFAAEMIEFTKNQILMQSGTAMLAQANQLGQSVLQLIG